MRSSFICWRSTSAVPLYPCKPRGYPKTLVFSSTSLLSLLQRSVSWEKNGLRSLYAGTIMLHFIYMDIIIVPKLSIWWKQSNAVSYQYHSETLTIINLGYISTEYLRWCSITDGFTRERFALQSLENVRASLEMLNILLGLRVRAEQHVHQIS